MGPLSFGKKDESIFLGREMAMHKNFSEKIAEHIDDEIKRIVDESYERALGLLRSNIQNLHNLSEILIEKENLTGDQVDEIIATGTLVCPEPIAPPVVEPSPPSTDIIA
jgi:cell division protease FtsH